MLNLVLFGAPGAGKGTQTERLVKKYGFNHISTGEIIRGEINKQTPLGNSMKDYIARGEFAPDELVIEMVKDFLSTKANGKGNIFDGFPRTLAQAEAFDKILSDNNMNPAIVVSIDVDYMLLCERILLRGQTSGRSDDSSLEVINNRMAIYNERTQPVVNHYANTSKHISCEGEGTLDEVFDRLCTEIDKLI